jgi:hypothetical protein
VSLIEVRVSGMVADPHHSSADLDPWFHCNAYPDPTFFLKC